MSLLNKIISDFMVEAIRFYDLRHVFARFKYCVIGEWGEAAGYGERI